MSYTSLYLIGLQRNLSHYISLGHSPQHAVQGHVAQQIASCITRCTSLQNLVIDLRYTSTEALRILLRGASHSVSLTMLTINCGVTQQQSRFIARFISLPPPALRAIHLIPKQIDEASVNTVIEALERSRTITTFDIRPQNLNSGGVNPTARWRLRIRTALLRNRVASNVPPQSNLPRKEAPLPQAKVDPIPLARMCPPRKYSPPRFVSPRNAAEAKPSPPENVRVKANVRPTVQPRPCFTPMMNVQIPMASPPRPFPKPPAQQQLYQCSLSPRGNCCWPVGGKENGTAEELPHRFAPFPPCRPQNPSADVIALLCGEFQRLESAFAGYSNVTRAFTSDAAESMAILRSHLARLSSS